MKNDGSGATVYNLLTDMVARVDWGAGTVTFAAFVRKDPGGAYLPVIGYTFIPPAAPGGAWTANTITTTGGAYVSSEGCIGGLMRTYNRAGTGKKVIEWHDGLALYDWTVGHNTTPEFFGLVDGYSGDNVYIKQHTILNLGA